MAASAAEMAALQQRLQIMEHAFRQLDAQHRAYVAAADAAATAAAVATPIPSASPVLMGFDPKEL